LSEGSPAAEAPKPEDLLSPLEKIIFNKFGKEGVDVYNLIDGEKTAEQILNETGVSESKLVEILDLVTVVVDVEDDQDVAATFAEVFELG
jgi:hypothetical protein